MKRFTIKQKVRYSFDNTIAKGTIALIGWLAILSTLVIVIFAAAVIIFAPPLEDGTQLGFRKLLWMGLMRTLDAGTMGGDDGSWQFLASMLGITLGGIFVVSTLIGVLTTGIDGQIDKIRKGRSLVVENDQTVILGWSEQIFTIISELIIANENKRHSCIVIMAEQDKVEMEDMIRANIGKTGKTRVVCRSGSPIDLNDLEIVNLQGSRSIIVLPPEGEDPDSQVIKTVLAITNNPQRRKAPYHIVAQIKNPKNVLVTKIVGGKEVQVVQSGDLISRIIAQTCRQSGLSVVYTELLDFGGDEIYFKEEPSMVGKTFGESLFIYEDSAVMGLQFKDGRVAINPPMDTKIAAGDQFIVISEDDDTIKLSGIKDLKITADAICDYLKSPRESEKTLILGWNSNGTTIINELDGYVASGSTIHVVADYAEAEDEINQYCKNLHHETVTFRKGDTTDREVLDELLAEDYNNIIVLCYSDILDLRRADAKTLVTLLHLRDIEVKTDRNFSIVSEMLDIRDRELANVTKADDFIVSDRLISLMLTQISENKYLTDVFADLFAQEGSEIYLNPARDYVLLGREINFYTIVEAARKCNQIAIGYRIFEQRNDADKAYGVVVNPEKSATITLSENDQIIVLAED